MSTTTQHDSDGKAFTVKLAAPDVGRLEALTRRIRGMRPTQLARVLLQSALEQAERDPAAWLIGGGDQATPAGAA